MKELNNILAIDLEARKRRVDGQREAPFDNDRSLRGTAAHVCAAWPTVTLGIINQLFEKNKIPDVVGRRMPVVFISPSANENNMARSLHYQADEFLIEPISVEEIVKIIDDSIDSRLRSDREHILAIGDLVLNRETLIVTWRNKKLPLHPLQVCFLEFLMRNPKRPITRMELLNNILGTDIYIDNRTIDRNIERIRDAFKRETKIDRIRSVRRVGYVFNDQFE